MREICEDRGLEIYALQAHGPVCRPDYHGEYLKMAIRYAAECGSMEQAARSIGIWRDLS